MSFNPLFTLLARGLVDLVEPSPDVIELGNQTLNADQRAPRTVLAHTEGRGGIVPAGSEGLVTQGPEVRRDQAGAYMRMLGFQDYQAIDVNDLYGSLVMDLNKDLAATYGYHRTFSLCTNNGTGEHVFNQDAIFRNVHALTKVGGVMIHVMPFIEYVNHGFYSFHPNLYYAVAEANGYRMLAMGVGARTGHGFLAVPPHSEEPIPEMLLDERRVPLRWLLAGAKPPKATLLDQLGFYFRPQDDGRRFHRELRRLQRKRPKLLLFAIMRKLEDAPFKTPIQLRYAEDIGDESLAREYGTTAGADA